MKIPFASKNLSVDLVRENPIWLRLAIILGVLGTSAIFALRLTESQLTLLLFALLGIATALFLVRWQAIGILIAALSGMLIPYSGPSGLNTSMIVVSFLLGIWIIEILLSRGGIGASPTRALWLSLAFIAVTILSLGVGQLNWYLFGRHAPIGAQLGGAAIYILSIGAFLLAAYRIENIRWLERLTWAFVVVGGLIVIVRMIPSAVSLTSGFLPNPGAIFWVWVTTISISQGLLNKRLSTTVRAALLLLTVLVIYHLFFQRYGNKSGWFTVFICIAGVLGSRSIKASAAIGVILIIFVLGSSLISDALLSEDYSYSTRIEAAEILLRMLEANPILGLGFANSRWYTLLFPIRGFEATFSSHNNFLDIAVQTGLLGLVIFVTLLVEVGLRLLRLRSRVPNGGFAEAYLYGAIGGFTGMVVAGALADWILPFFYNIGMDGFRTGVIGWIFLGGVYMLDRAYPAPISN